VVHDVNIHMVTMQQSLIRMGTLLNNQNPLPVLIHTPVPCHVQMVEFVSVENGRMQIKQMNINTGLPTQMMSMLLMILGRVCIAIVPMHGMGQHVLLKRCHVVTIIAFMVGPA
jgi:hypothetical protein